MRYSVLDATGHQIVSTTSYQEAIEFKSMNQRFDWQIVRI